ncbi:RecT-like protein [Shewanella sp. phage 1/41]|uniref:Bet-like ssDNA annealing protein n=1 Tax=Shewanella sp. phage 1/41 TaxID=1458861 RepID=UPI0004F75BA7|nr:Bet-like ssDNA annealing protein [Shewanella sp. phage 1/41]AHK11653.1 RecT-like protein [Shewanella sp. phage 1/41]
MTTALAIVAANTGASEEDIKNVISGMIISSKGQHGAKATSAEMAVFTGVCSKYSLNPLVKECAAFVSGGKLQVIVMIDGWYKMVNRQENFDGVEFEDKFSDDGKIISITCKMHIKNRSHPVCVTEYLAECKDPKSTVWTRWPARMLRHKAYIQAARIAFGISEVIDDDEASRIDSKPMQERDITPRASVNLTDIDTTMADCYTLDELKHTCGKIREEMQANGTWDSLKAEIIALNIKHKDRINSASAKKDEPIYDQDTGEDVTETESSEAEAIEGELLSSDDGITSNDDDDIGFGEDDEFGER